MVRGAEDKIDGLAIDCEEVGAGVGAPPKWDACQSPIEHRVRVDVDGKFVNLDRSKWVG